jgi:hypothetical protein
MRHHIVATTPTHYLDMRSGFDPPLSAHSNLHLPVLVLRGDRTHLALARSAELLSGAVPNGSLITLTGASHFMIATHAALPRQLCLALAGHPPRRKVLRIRPRRPESDTQQPFVKVRFKFSERGFHALVRPWLASVWHQPLARSAA